MSLWSTRHRLIISFCSTLAVAITVREATQAQQIIACGKNLPIPACLGEGTEYDPDRRCVGGAPCGDVQTSESGGCTTIVNVVVGESGYNARQGFDRECVYTRSVCQQQGGCGEVGSFTKTARCHEVSGTVCTPQPGGGGPPTEEPVEGI